MDTSFLHMEDQDVHMHVASVLVFAGDPPPYDEFVEAIESRLHLVPRYRQRLAAVPLGQGRPVWVDDPHLNLRYHVRVTALPPPGDEGQLRTLAGRVFSQRLDRDKPLWELWLAEGLEGDRFAVLGKTHHALVDGVSGADLMSVLFETAEEPAVPAVPAQPWLPQPLPAGAQLLAQALLERATAPAEIARSVRAVLRAPRQLAQGALEAALGVGGMVWGGIRPAPKSPYNCRIGPHRRFTWVRTRLEDVKAIKNELGGTVNDVVLAAVAGALGRHLRRRRQLVEGLDLRAMVPVSVRTDVERGALGNRVAAMMAPLPVWCQDPVDRLAIVGESMKGLKEGGHAVGADVLTRLGGFAPPTVMSQATRLAMRQRFFNLVVTNVPGPQFPLYLMGRELVDVFPMVPLARNQALGIAIMSYNGHLNFGLVGDFDGMADIDDLASDLAASLEELAEAAGVEAEAERAEPARATNGHPAWNRAP